jgi:hypothetical protein
MAFGAKNSIMCPGKRKTGCSVVENVFNPVILGMAARAVCRVTLCLVIQGNVELSLMAAYAGLWSYRHTSLMTIRALHNTFVCPL